MTRAPRTNLPPQIKRRELPSGAVRYEVIADVTRNGKRHQTRKRFARLQDAKDHLATVQGDVVRGVHVRRSVLTVEQAIDAWLSGQRLRPKTRSAYVTALRPVVDALGDKPVQKVTKSDIETVVRSLVEGTSAMGIWNAPTKLAKNAKKMRSKWAATSINPMLARLRSIWQDLVDQGVVSRNVPALVRPLPTVKPEMHPMSVEQVETLFEHMEGERLELFVHLALMGLRRGEIGGLRWSAIDLESTAPTLSVSLNRVAVDGGTSEADPKTEAGRRELPIPDELLPLVRRARKRSREEQMAAGSKWVGQGHVISDECGRPYHPDTLYKYWERILKDAKLPHVRLHDARHSCATLMHQRGVPLAVIAAWLGHTDASFTLRTYAHSTPSALADAATTLGGLVTSRDTSGKKEPGNPAG
ncbi:tyrosine-type recombinase/integrase [Mycobacteroides abscessus]|uniref:tyrosine-type recombinase/integrase n=1 Tax=Mycobacteroides abscessus TaxID=36809 RepID=UPI000C2697A5|nr:site-specific integrase [Mycobacteroides abscessus]